MALTTINSSGIKDDSIVNADIKSDAAIAKSKLASLSITNADIDANAAIAFSKLASLPAELTGSTNNQITTVTGANAIQGEANLTFDGDYLFIGGATASDAINGAQNFIIKDTSSDGGMSFLSGASGLGQIHFSDTDANGQGRVVYNHNGNSLGLYTDGSERLNIDGYGIHKITKATISGQGSNCAALKVNDDYNHYGVISVKDQSASNEHNACFQAINAATGSDVTNNMIRSVDADSQNWAHGRYCARSHLFNINGSTNTTTKVKIDSDGIKFGSDTAAANALDEYEEGTYTPTFTFGGSFNGTVSAAYGTYTKIGRVCHINVNIQLSSKGTHGGVCRFTLPFASSNILSGTSVESGGLITYHNGFNTNLSTITATPVNNSSYVLLRANYSNANSFEVDNNDVDDDLDFRCTMTYFT